MGTWTSVKGWMFSTFSRSIGFLSTSNTTDAADSVLSGGSAPARSVGDVTTRAKGGITATTTPVRPRPAMTTTRASRSSVRTVVER